jgi:hypothetical protein
MVEIDDQELLREARFWGDVTDFCVRVAALTQTVQEKTTPGKDLHVRASHVRLMADGLKAQAELRCSRERAVVDRLLSTACDVAKRCCCGES